MIFLLFCTLCFCIFIVQMIYFIISGSINLGFNLLFFKHEKDLKKKGLAAEQKQKEKQRKEYEKQQKLLDYDKFTQDKQLAMASITKVNEFKYKYPYADEYLFTKYLNKFYDANFIELKEMEDEIINSHIENKKKPELNYKTYTLKDLENFHPLESRIELPLEMKLYKIKTDYVLHLYNKNFNIHNLYQSKNYLNILRFMMNILDEMNLIKYNKRQITAVDYDKILNSIITNEVFSIREKTIIDKINKGLKDR